MVVKLPWRPVKALPPGEFTVLRRRAIFECFKWDPQVGDVATLAPFPLILEADEWAQLACLAEKLARETARAEAELVVKTELHATLHLPRAVEKALRHVRDRGLSPGCARLVRFDFHLTTDGWRISEANTDVPGGLNEASGFTRLMAECHPGHAPAGDPAARYAEAILAATHPGAKIVLAHATAYSDDNQVMSFLARELESRGARVCKLSPAHLTWRGGSAHVDCDWEKGQADVVARFFPAEWLPNLGPRSGWPHFLAGGTTPLSNPATALLTQSKRFPLVWDALESDLPTWRALLPETRDPRDADIEDCLEWVVKPALGRVGDGVGIPGVNDAKEWQDLARSARRHPGEWIAQRRFEAIPLQTEAGLYFPCIGVYTIDGRVAGAYGRIARRALIDTRAQDVAVLIAPAARGEGIPMVHDHPGAKTASPACSTPACSTNGPREEST